MDQRLLMTVCNYLQNKGIVKGDEGQEYDALVTHFDGLTSTQLTALLKKFFITLGKGALDSAQFTVPTDDESL
ncbi:hypothetical protein LCGC14_0375280 [marine sediment metagenome]|uniref:Uncharacterized protein n=1 Tax=marine sediment metagenome TaxID=412755 RepID=A0A0F9VR74_9ZZZZ